MMDWHRFKDIGERLEGMYCRLTGQLDRIIAILDDMRGFFRDTAYWYEPEDEEDGNGGCNEDN